VKKALLSMAASTVLALSLVACGGESRNQASSSVASESTSSSVSQSTVQSSTTSESSSQSGASSASAASEKSDGKVLVAYFSRVGNTDSNFPEGVDIVSSASLLQQDDKTYGNAELMATWLGEATGGDLFAIQTSALYPADYDATVTQARNEQSESARPPLSTHVDNMAGYDTVVLVYPNWWGDLPMTVYSFLDEYDLAGKQVVAYCTHEGSGFSNTIQKIQDAEPQATVREGVAVRGGNVPNCRDELQTSVESLGLSA
jgi:flavodoxin